ncbi:hypothetical protein A9Z42_0076720 [Trichoderma parareesei]|uniref:Uncharacterized protein n=1 Tax=Trichoderma parareesei TaxID=858221 RepID=A0A2H2ZJG1_TRIPA|nr:hypothetical protein A9Z42_0076720 [Trichoderma parareesei]
MFSAETSLLHPIGTVPHPEQRRERAVDSSGPSKLSIDSKVSEAAYPQFRSQPAAPAQFRGNPSILTGSEWLQPMPRSSNRRPSKPPFRSIEAVAPGVVAVVCRAECIRSGGASRGKPTMAAPPPPGLCSAVTELRRMTAFSPSRSRSLKMMADESLYGRRSIG